MAHCETENMGYTLIKAEIASMETAKNFHQLMVRTLNDRINELRAKIGDD